MNLKRFFTIEEKQSIYHSEFIRYGVDISKAARAAEILALEISDEKLTQEEIELVNEACKAWLAGHKQYKNLNLLLPKYKT